MSSEIWEGERFLMRLQIAVSCFRASGKVRVPAVLSRSGNKVSIGNARLLTCPTRTGRTRPSSRGGQRPRSYGTPPSPRGRPGSRTCPPAAGAEPTDWQKGPECPAPSARKCRRFHPSRTSRKPAYAGQSPRPAPSFQPAVHLSVRPSFLSDTFPRLTKCTSYIGRTAPRFRPGSKYNTRISILQFSYPSFAKQQSLCK